MMYMKFSKGDFIYCYYTLTFNLGFGFNNIKKIDRYPFPIRIKISTFALDLSKQKLERACVMAN